MAKPANLENLRLVLVRTRNPLNVGAAARAMSNFGAFHLRLVAPYEKAFREAVSAVGAGPVLRKAEELASLGEAVSDCRLVVGTTAVGHRQLPQQVHPLPEAAKLIRRNLSGGRVAILFGSEKTGLTNQELSHCHWLLRIPTRAEHRSMNLAQAVAVVVYSLADPSLLPGATSKIPRVEAQMDALDRLGRALNEALLVSGYIHPRSAAAAEEKMRRMLLRFKLNAADAEVLLGMLHKIVWKLREGR